MDVNYRKEWFNWVAKERKKMQRKNKAATHRQAMAAASITWPKQKARLQKRCRYRGFLSIRFLLRYWGLMDAISHLQVRGLSRASLMSYGENGAPGTRGLKTLSVQNGGLWVGEGRKSSTSSRYHSGMLSWQSRQLSTMSRSWGLVSARFHANQVMSRKRSSGSICFPGRKSIR